MQVLKNYFWNIRTWSNTVGVIPSTIKPFGPCWIQLITPTVFDLENDSLIHVHIYKGSKHCRKTQSGSHLILYRTDNICNARYHRTRIMEDNLILPSDVSPWSPCKSVVSKQKKFWSFLQKIPWCLILYYYYAWIIPSSIETCSCTDSTDLHGLHGLTSEKDNYLIHIAQWARYRAHNFLSK